MTDPKAVSALVSEHGVWLSAFLRGLTQCEADAEDSFQEVWLRVLKGDGPHADAATRGYLARVARSVVIDRYRRNGRYETTLDEVDESGLSKAEALVDEAPVPSARFESASTHEEVLAAVRALPAKLREVVLLRIEGELTFQEIAEELKVPLGTVLTWMRSATKRLKAALGV